MRLDAPTLLQSQPNTYKAEELFVKKLMLVKLQIQTQQAQGKQQNAEYNLQKI